jgi:hypothetical protein
MAKPKPASRSIDLSADELYRMARALTAPDEGLLRKRRGGRSTTVLHIDAVKADMEEAFSAESSHQERDHQPPPAGRATRSGRGPERAVAELEALPKPR